MNSKLVFLFGFFIVAIVWSQGSVKGVHSLTYKLKEQDGSFTRLTSQGKLNCGGIVNSNPSPSSQSEPWKFSIYVMSASDFSSANIRPKGIGTWTLDEIDLIDKAIQYWNNSGARILIEKKPASQWEKDYKDAASLSNVHSYTIVKATSTVFDESGSQVFPDPKLVGAMGLTVQQVLMGGSTVNFPDGTVSDGTNTTSVIRTCNAIVDKKLVEKCLKKKPGCSSVVLSNGSLDPACVTIAPGIVDAYAWCDYTGGGSDVKDWKCFEKRCDDVYPGTSIPDYEKCISGLSKTICPDVNNVRNNMIIIDYRTAQAKKWALTPSDIYEATPKWVSNTELYLNSDKNSFLSVVIHEIGHYLGLEHDNRLYDVHEPAVKTSKSMKDMALESFNAPPLFGVSYYPMSPSSKLYAHSGLNNIGPSYVGPDGNVYRLELKDKTYSEPGYSSVITKRWDWVPSTENASDVLSRAQRRYESVMSTDQDETTLGYEVPKYLLFKSYLAYGDECLLTAIGCGYSKVLNVGYYPAFYDLNKAYSANPSTNHFLNDGN